MDSCLNPACDHPHADHLPVCIRCPCEQFVFPVLNAPVADCGGSQLTREWTEEQPHIAEDAYDLNPTYANQCRVRCFKMMLPLFIDEIDTTQ